MIELILAEGDGFVTTDDLGVPIADFPNLLNLLEYHKDSPYLETQLALAGFTRLQSYSPVDIIREYLAEYLKISWNSGESSMPVVGGPNETWRLSTNHLPAVKKLLEALEDRLTGTSDTSPHECSLIRTKIHSPKKKGDDNYFDREVRPRDLIKIRTIVKDFYKYSDQEYSILYWNFLLFSKIVYLLTPDQWTYPNKMPPKAINVLAEELTRAGFLVARCTPIGKFSRASIMGNQGRLGTQFPGYGWLQDQLQVSTDDRVFQEGLVAAMNARKLILN